jgi:uncharacterized membrane protein
MIEVILYTREDCHLCETTRNDLGELNIEIPFKLTIVDVDSDPVLQKEYGFNVPVIIVGPYKIRAPIDRKDLEVTLKAAQRREQQISKIDSAQIDGALNLPVSWTKGDDFSLWLSRHYLSAFNIFILIYFSLPLLAPVLMKVGATVPAGWIYRAYGAVCHQLAFRSWFLFGEQPVYPRQSAGVAGLIPYGQETGLNENDLWTAREFRGNEVIGYKVALCERDVAIYGGMLLFGLVFSISGRRSKPLHWIVWILLGLVPIGLDGVSQLVSQPPLNLIIYRESTPMLRSLTGFLFGFMTAWFGYPYVEESMRESKKIMERKLNRVHQIANQKLN